MRQKPNYPANFSTSSTCCQPRAAASYGLALPLGRGLVGALAHFGLDGRAGAEKDAMRQLVLRGGPWSQSERQAILEWLQVEASKAARWLGHVPFDRIVDARNDAPVIIVRDDDAPEVPMVSSRISPSHGTSPQAQAQDFALHPRRRRAAV